MDLCAGRIRSLFRDGPRSDSTTAWHRSEVFLSIAEGPLTKKVTLTTRANESNPSLLHPQVTRQRLRLTRSQSTFATSFGTTHVSNRNRRNRMYSFDRGTARHERDDSDTSSWRSRFLRSECSDPVSTAGPFLDRESLVLN